MSTVIAGTPDGFLDHALDRSKYFASQTPQAFEYSLLAHAYAQCTEADWKHGTECLHLVQMYGGVRAKLVEATPLCWKITHKPDIYAAEQIIKGTPSALRTRRAVLCRCAFGAEMRI